MAHLTNCYICIICQNINPKALDKIVADSILNFFIFQRKTRLNISCELSVRQIIHMKCQALFSLKNVKRNLKVSSAVVVISS